MKIRPGTTQVLPRATPSRHHRSQNLHCAGGIATPTPGTTKQVGKCLPVFMQTRPGTCFEQPLKTIVGTRQPAPRVINDPDGGVAVGGDINQRTKRLSTRGGLIRQQPGLGVLQAQMNQDCSTFSEDSAIGQHQRGDLHQRVNPPQRLLSRPLLPTAGSAQRKRHRAALKRDLDSR